MKNRASVRNYFQSICATLLVFALSATLPLKAQVVVGSQHVNSIGAFSIAAPYTLIDISHPADADATLTNGSVQWGAGHCANAYKVKILRPAGIGLSTFTLVGERGPFTSQIGANVFAISPPLPVKKGDLIAVTVLNTFALCGSPSTAQDANSVVMPLAGDVSSGSFNGTYIRNQALAARATTSAEVLEGVIAGAGSLKGNFGSYFRTSLQIGGQGFSSATTAGKLVFHPAGAAASPNDPSLPFTVTGSSVLSYDDVVQSMGQSGLGTIDVVTTSGAPPSVTARVYNDNGASGTSGFTEELITPENALHNGDLATYLVPPDLTNYRVNIGVRAFSTPLKLNVQYGFRGQVTVTFPANTFQQISLGSLTTMAALPNERIFLWVLEGDAVIYASTTDNRTNDSSIHFMRRE